MNGDQTHTEPAPAVGGAEPREGGGKAEWTWQQLKCGSWDLIGGVGLGVGLTSHRLTGVCFNFCRDWNSQKVGATYSNQTVPLSGS